MKEKDVIYFVLDKKLKEDFKECCSKYYKRSMSWMLGDMILKFVYKCKTEENKNL